MVYYKHIKRSYKMTEFNPNRNVNKDDVSGMEMYSCIANFVEVPRCSMTVGLDETTYNACKEYANGKPLTSSIGSLVEKFVADGFKPFSKPVSDSFKMVLKDGEWHKMKIVVHEDTLDKLRSLAKKQNLKQADYLRVCLCAILVDKVKSYE